MWCSNKISSARGKWSIPLFARVCWGYKFKKSTQLEGESLRLWTTFFGSEKIYDWIACGDEFDHIVGIVNSRYGEKDISSDSNWSFLSRLRAEVVRPNNIWFGVVHGSMNRVAHNSGAAWCIWRPKAKIDYLVWDAKLLLINMNYVEFFLFLKI